MGSVNLASESITRVLTNYCVDVPPLSPGVTRHLVCAVGILVLLIAEPARAQGFKWWQSEEVQQDLHLTVDQVKEIERIYDASLPERRKLRADLDRLEQQLQQLLDRPEVEERDAALLIDRVETARARRNAARTIMLFRIGRVLTPRQRTALAQRAVKRQ
jgi:Spy/CpxP family protein refolding chaperone